MLNPDAVAQLRQAIRADQGLERFHNYAIARTEIRAIEQQRSQALVVAPEYTAKLTMPARIFGQPFDKTCMNGIGPFDLRVPAKTLYTLPNARIIGNNSVLGSAGEAFAPAPVLLDADLKRFLEQNATNHQGFAAERIGDRVFVYYVARRTVKEFRQRALFLHNLEPSNYGSFLFRQLPQLLLLHDVPIEFDLYVVPERTAWLREALQMIGLPDRPILTVKEVTGDKFDCVTFFNEFDAEGFLSDDVTSRMTALSRTVWPSRIYPDAQKLYISRLMSAAARPDYRQLHGEADVEAFFERRGFRVVYPEALSFAEQISLFRNARTVVGPSGSGMLNAIFSESGARILDMESFHFTVRQHAKIYGSSGKSYAFLFGTLDSAANLPPHIRGWSVSQDLLQAACDWLAV